MDASKLKGVAVVSLTEGTRLGYVDQVLFDTPALRITALQIKGDGGMFLVPFAQIQHIGSDAVTVASSQVTQATDGRTVPNGGFDLTQIVKLKVVDRGGTFLGTVSTLDSDPSTGRLVQLTAQKGGVLGIGTTTTAIEPGMILGVGPELITLNTDTAATPSSSIAPSEPVT